jgi:hypothetical protein
VQIQLKICLFSCSMMPSSPSFFLCLSLLFFFCFANGDSKSYAFYEPGAPSSSSSSYFDVDVLEILENVTGGMLEVKQSESREVLDLSGVWNFRTDYIGAGFDEEW